MNYTPMDSSFQCASFESKKILPRIFHLREIHKKPKKLIFWHIFGSHTNKWGLWPELSPMPDFNSSHTITHRNFVRIGDKNFFRKNHEPLPSIKFAPGKNI
jgi:hypothetical protein